MKDKPTLILGASANPSRYSFKAILALRRAGYTVFGLGIKRNKVADVSINTEWPKTHSIDTISLYLNPKNQAEYYDRIKLSGAKRLILNPGSENSELVKHLEKTNIEIINACTLVMLSTDQY